MSWFKKVLAFITPLSYVEVSVRDRKNKYVKNEAYTKVIKKKPKARKKK